MTEPKETLLFEYGLNFIQYQMLALLAENGPITWPDPRFKAVSGQPGQSLRKLVDRGLLTGPTRQQKIKDCPFALNEQGATVLNKVQRGLHLVSWLSPHKWAAMARLSEGPLPVDDREGIKLVTLRSLVENGYVGFDGYQYTMSALGREAWAEAGTDNRKMCRICQSARRAYSATAAVANQPCFDKGRLEHYQPDRRRPATIPVNCRRFSHVNGGRLRR